MLKRNILDRQTVDKVCPFAFGYTEYTKSTGCSLKSGVFCAFSVCEHLKISLSGGEAR